MLRSSSCGRASLATISALVGIFMPAIAAAQSTDGGFALNRFEPAPAGDSFFGVASPTVAGRTRVSAVLLGDYAHAPLVLRRGAGGEELGKVVSDQLHLHANVSFALFERLLVHANLPVAVLNQGGSPTIGAATFTSPSSASVGDLRLGLRGRIFGEVRDPFQISIGVNVWLPTGSRASFTGDGRARVSPLLLLGGRIADFVWSATGGVAIRNDRAILDNRVQNELTFGVGAALLLADDKVQIGPEMYGTTAAFGEAKPFERKTTTGELLFGFKWRPNPLVIGVAGGTGFGVGLGTPDARVVGLVGYAPWDEPAPPEPAKPLDGDGDGVLDADDACPTVKGIKTDDRKTNGCPDKDGDGIVDAVDACPDTKGVRSDDPKKNGCPADKDEDGIVDAEDACPDVKGVKSDDPKKNGCPPDKDEDGIVDAEDACPDVKGVKSDDPKKNGCPPDKDGDGIVDAEDACPDEPGVPDPDPKKNGCPKVVLTAKAIVILEQVHFEFGKATIMPDSDALLSQIAKVMKDHPEIKKVSIEGHTDNKGNALLNQTLSQKRAEAVVKWLVDHGVEKERLQSKGFGMSKPIGDNKTDAGREMNRRVEFKIIDPKPPADAPTAPGAKK